MLIIGVSSRLSGTSWIFTKSFLPPFWLSSKCHVCQKTEAPLQLRQVNKPPSSVCFINQNTAQSPADWEHRDRLTRRAWQLGANSQTITMRSQPRPGHIIHNVSFDYVFWVFIWSSQLIIQNIASNEKQCFLFHLEFIAADCFSWKVWQLSI